MPEKGRRTNLYQNHPLIGYKTPDLYQNPVHQGRQQPKHQLGLWGRHASCSLLLLDWVLDGKSLGGRRCNQEYNDGLDQRLHQQKLLYLRREG